VKVRSTMIPLAVVVGLYLAWCVLLWLMQGKVLYPAAMAGPGLPEKAIAAEGDVERMWIGQDDGVETEAWLLRAASTPSRGLVCFVHGNAELIDDARFEAREWTRRGFDVVLPEYRGYGRTPGTPSQARIVPDVVRAIDEASARTGATRVLLHGRSLGSGVAAQVAGRIGASDGDRLAGLVLESPFTSVTSFAWRFGVPPAFVRDPYRTDAALPKLAVPILILHATADEIIPVAHGRTLATLNPDARLVELEGSHNSGLSSQAEYWRAIDAVFGPEP
jgi:pimeloyl-ACP methyl ester carboxylesterase